MGRPTQEWQEWWTDDLAVLLLRQWDPLSLGTQMPADEYSNEAGEIAEPLRASGSLQDVLEAMQRIVDRNRGFVEVDVDRDRRAAHTVMEW